MDIPSVVSAQPAGTTFVIYPGIYHTQQIQPKNGDSFIGEIPCTPPQIPCPAILNGSSLLTSFRMSGSLYYATTQKQRNYVSISATECQSGYPGCIYPEDLYFDNAPLTHVTSLADVGPGTWFFDYSAATIYFYDNPAGHTVETSVTPEAFAPGPANNVTIQGLTIEKFATPIMMGAVGGAGTGYGSPTAGANWVVKNNEIRLNHADGVRPNFGWQVLNNYIHHNGDFAIGGGIGGGNADGSGTMASGVLIQGNEMAFNNYAHVSPGWGAGGTKATRSRGLVYRANFVHDNLGPGLWTDISNYNSLYDGNIIQDNPSEGAFHEISYGPTVMRNNKLLRNGYSMLALNSGGYYSNLESSSSQNVEAYCNTIEVSAQGGNAMSIIAANRGNDSQAPYTYYISSGNYFHHNTVTWDGSGNIGFVGAMQYDSANQPNSYSLNSFDYNSYHLPTLSMAPFQWLNGQLKTFAQFQAAGQDTHGSVDTKSTSSIPSVTITSPVDGAAVSGTVSITGNVQDSTPISKVELYVDWSLNSTVTTSNPFLFNWTPSGLSAGPHTVAAMAHNLNGIQACYAVTVNLQ